mmetsp:Transcript_14266/g.40956  ORF Transcript_14266/g.40956 Transcript_14266/m.40956 type:complete len:449 (-) Transcript_14266:2782-4128(-)
MVVVDSSPPTSVSTRELLRVMPKRSVRSTPSYLPDMARNPPRYICQESKAPTLLLTSHWPHRPHRLRLLLYSKGPRQPRMKRRYQVWRADKISSKTKRSLLWMIPARKNMIRPKRPPLLLKIRRATMSLFSMTIRKEQDRTRSQLMRTDPKWIMTRTTMRTSPKKNQSRRTTMALSRKEKWSQSRRTPKILSKREKTMMTQSSRLKSMLRPSTPRQKLRPMKITPTMKWGAKRAKAMPMRPAPHAVGLLALIPLPMKVTLSSLDPSAKVNRRTPTRTKGLERMSNRPDRRKKHLNRLNRLKLLSLAPASLTSRGTSGAKKLPCRMIWTRLTRRPPRSVVLGMKSCRKRKRLLHRRKKPASSTSLTLLARRSTPRNARPLPVAARHLSTTTIPPQLTSPRAITYPSILPKRARALSPGPNSRWSQNLHSFHPRPAFLVTMRAMRSQTRS